MWIKVYIYNEIYCLQISTNILFNFDALKECFKISGSKSLMIVALDDFDEDSWAVLQWLREDLRDN